MRTQTTQKRVQFARALRRDILRVFAVAVLVFALFLTTHPVTTTAATPTLNFQARLENGTGAIAPDGYYNVEFKLYQGGTSAGGGTLKWTETYYDSNGVTAGNDNRVRVANGYLTVNLGSLTNFPGTINWDADLFLSMNIGGTTQTATPTYDGEMTPLLKLTSVPYAFQAQSATQLEVLQGANTGTLLFDTLSADQTLTLPDETGTVCTNAAGGVCSALGSYIQNQNASAQSSSNFWIDGTGRAASLQIAAGTGALDTVTSGVLNIGTTNATQINLNQNVVVAANKSLTITGGNTASRPASPTEGTLYYDTTTKQLLTYANGKWQGDRSTATKIVAASNSSQALKDAADYVATGTGDQAQINSALTAAAGGKVYLAEGTYTVNASISIPNNTTLVGAGSGTVITIPNSFNAAINVITNSDTSTGTGITVSNLEVDGNKASQTSGLQNGIYFNHLGNVAASRQGAIVQNIRASNFRNVGIGLTYSDNSVVSSNISNNNYYGIDVENTYNTSVTANTMNQNTFGIYASTVGQVTVSGNAVSSGSNDGYQINSSTAVTVTGNTSDSNAGNGFKIYNSTDVTVTGNTASGNTFSGVALVWTNNSIVSSNRLVNNGGATTSDSVYIGASNSNTITGNYSTDSSCTTNCYAINIDSSSSTNYLSDNTLGGGSINDAGTGTIYGGQVNGSGNYVIQPAGTVELVGTTNVANDLNVSGWGTFSAGNVWISTGDVADDQIHIVVSTGGSGGYFGTITNADLTAARTWTLPNESGTICVSGGTACATAGSGFVQFAPASVQADATNNNSIYINKTSGTGNIIELQKAGTDVFAISNSGDATFSQNVTVAANKTITLTGGATGSRPASPTEGMLYYDTTTKQLLVYANGKWQADRTEAVIVAASNSSQADKDAADYVADGNTGAANDGDQVQINAALTAAAGRKVVLLAGTYTVDNSILVPNNTTLTGMGDNTFITLPNSFSTNMSIITNSNHGLVAANHDITISNLEVDGNVSNVTGAQIGIDMSADNSGTTAMKNIAIEHVIVQNMTAGGIYSEAHYSHFENSIFDNDNCAIDFDGQASYNTISGNTFLNNINCGIFFWTAGKNSIVGNTFQNDGIGIDIEGTGATNNTVSGNSLVGDGTTTFSNAIFLGYSAQNNTVSDNAISGFGYGIQIISSSNNTISGNNLDNNGTSTQNEAIYIETADSNLVIGNNITDATHTTANYGIDINNSSSDTNYLNGNYLNGASINDAGTGTIYGGQNNGTSYLIQPADDFAITGTTASTISTAAGNLTLQAGSGTVTLGSSTSLIASGALSITSGGANTLTVDTGGAAVLNLGTTNANAVSISKTGVTTTVNGALTVTQAATFNSTAQFNDNVTVAANKSLTLTGGATGSRPGSPTEGTLFYDTTTKQLLAYANGKWQADRSTSTKIVAASNSSQALKDAADYVATGTGDQAQINAALTAAAGGKVYLAEGTYTINASISIPNNTTLVGAGTGTVITIPNSFNASINAITNTDTTTGTGVTVSNLQLDGNRTNQTSGTQKGIYLNGMGNGPGGTSRSGATISNLKIINFNDNGMMLNNSDNNDIENNYLQNNTANDAIFLQSSNLNTIHGNFMQGNGSAVYLYSNSNNNKVFGNTSDASNYAGFTVSGSYENDFSQNIARDTANGSGFFLDGANRNTFTGNTATGTLTYPGFWLYDGSSENTLTGNVSSSNNEGIDLGSGTGTPSNNTINANIIKDSTSYGIWIGGNNNIVSNNTIQNSGGSTDNNGITTSAGDSNTLTANKISDTSATTTNYAINISNSTSDTNYLADNSLGGGSINDAGTGTIYGGQLNASSAYVLQASGGINLNSATTFSANLTVTNAGNVAYQKGSDYSTTGTTNNVNFGTGVLFRLTGASTQTITGIAGGVDGRIMTLVNAAGQSAILKNNDSTDSSAGNLIITGTGNDYTVAAGSSVSLVYDSASSVWRIVSSVAGAVSGASYVTLQGSTPGTQEIGNINVSGTIIGATSVQAGGGSVDQAALIVKRHTTQTTPLIVLQNSGGGEIARIDASTCSAFFGYGAGNGSLGTCSTAIGSYALYQNTIGSNNTALGNSALTSNLDGSSNIAVGDTALYANTSGNSNTAIGYSALQSNTTGSDNIAIGYLSQMNAGTGSSNISLGNNTLANISNETGNTAIGQSALNSTTGSYNTALGYRAGWQDSGGWKSNITSALQNATAIGAYAQVQTSNSIVLGSVDTATKVGIGITAPSNMLSVSPIHYQTGTATRTNSSATLVGTGTTWTSAMVGDIIVFPDGTTNTVSAFTDATHITMGTTYTGTTDATPIKYRFHYSGLQVTTAGSTVVGDLVVGTATNNVTFASGSSFEPILNGSARHTKKIVLTPEYAGATLDAASDSSCSSANSGTMTSGYDSTNRTNYYDWTSTQASAQCYDVVVQVPIPSDWSAWTSTPINVQMKKDATGTAAYAIQVINSSGSSDTTFCATTYCSPGTIATSWGNMTASNAFAGSGYAAGDYFTIKIRMSSTSSANTFLGNITLTYLSKY